MAASEATLASALATASRPTSPLLVTVVPSSVTKASAPRIITVIGAGGNLPSKRKETSVESTTLLNWFQNTSKTALLTILGTSSGRLKSVASAFTLTFVPSIVLSVIRISAVLKRTPIRRNGEKIELCFLARISISPPLMVAPVTWMAASLPVKGMTSSGQLEDRSVTSALSRILPG